MGGDRNGTLAAVDADVSVSFTVNGVRIEISVDPRVTLLDAIRNVCGLTGSKKGCDQGQCGACTMLVGARRINSCLSLAVTHEGDDITTIEGVGSLGHLHPMQTAFVEHDGLQCGFCTPGQICSAIGALDEMRRGVPSHVSDNPENIELSEDEIRERMSGNLCRCAAYPNIVAAIRDVAEAQL